MAHPFQGIMLFVLRIMVLTALYAGHAHARLGWTMQQCEAKYGPAKIVVQTGREVKDSSMEALFNYQNWRIRVAWFPGCAKAQFIKYTANASKMTKEQLDAILTSNSDGQKWEAFFDRGNKMGVAIASAFSGSDMRSGYFQREDGARTGTIMLWAINNVSIKSAGLREWEKQNEAAQEAKKRRVPDL